MNAIACAHHADRAALAYCAGCGKALCAECVVRLSTGNYCESCAETPDHRPAGVRPRRSRVLVWVGLAVLLAAGYALLTLF
ncbi:MAG: B-box zinc finger protein [bacterium]